MNSRFRNVLLALALITLFPSRLQALDWPQWRGPDRSDVSKETGLLTAWPASGPKRIWLFENAGEGYSGPAIVSGKLFTMGTRNGAESLLALDANTGKELWVSTIGGLFREGHGDGPRGTPAVDGDRLYALTGEGILVCANVSDGKILWQKTMASLGGHRPGWGYTESVLVDGSQVICTPGGSKGAMAALDKMTGELIWQSSEFTDPAHYASIVPTELNGTRQYIQLTVNSLAGLNAKDGKLLWKTPFPGRTAVVPTPIVHENYVYAAAGYGVGCKLVKIGRANEVTEVYQNGVMKNHHGGVILVGDYVYGYSDGAGWVCQNFKTGEQVWAQKGKLGKGAVACADGMLYCVEESSGTVVLIEASPKGWAEHGRFKLDPQSKIRSPQGRVWTHPVICNGKLYLRDQELIYCFSIIGQATG